MRLPLMTLPHWETLKAHLARAHARNMAAATATSM